MIKRLDLRNIHAALTAIIVPIACRGLLLRYLGGHRGIGFRILAAVGALGKIEGRVEGIEVTAVEMILDIPEDFAETLKVYDFPFAEEADRIGYLRIFHHAQDVFIGAAGFLFCCNHIRTTLD